jgi:tripartite-type tricarboxylate transporter receptor subunit TctC
MHPSRHRRLILGAATAAVLPVSFAARAATDYPRKPVRLLVPFGAGGITDVIARAFAEQLAHELGQPVIVDNKPGAGGNLAAEALKKSAPDGYTLMLTTLGVLAVNPHAYANPRFDPLVDFSYVSTVADTPHAVVVGSSVPAPDLQALISLAKQKPEAVSFGTAGYGSSPYQGMRIIESAAGVSFLHVPFKSGAEALNAIMGGQVAMTLEALPVVLPLVPSGKLRALAIAAPKRHASAPELKTTAELGCPYIVSSSASGLVGPAGLPADITSRLDQASQAALGNPQLKARLLAQGSDATGSSPANYLTQVRAEHTKWAKLLAGSPKI